MLKIDFFPYFSYWVFHHQVDWALIQAFKKDGHDTRVISLKDPLESLIASRRDFDTLDLSHKNQASQRNQFVLNKLFGNYLLKDRSRPIEPNKIDLSNYFQEMKEMKRAICDQTVMSHYQCSKCDLDIFDESLRSRYNIIFDIELAQIEELWSTHGVPDRIVLFNGRLIPYNIPYFLGKIIGIPIYIHERGRSKPYSFTYNEQPSSATALRKLAFKNLNLPVIKDKKISEIIGESIAEVKDPEHYPTLYPRNDNKELIKRSKPIITFIISSDDEVDCELDSNLAQAQRDAIKFLCTNSEIHKKFSVVIKSHPRIYGMGSLVYSLAPGLKNILIFLREMENIASLKNDDDLIFFSEDCPYNPFSLIEASKVVIGLHSTLIEYAWLNGKSTITHIDTDASVYAEHICDFSDYCQLEETISSSINNISKQNKSISKFEALKRYYIRGSCIDVDFGPLTYPEKEYFKGLEMNQLMTMAESFAEKTISDDFYLIYESIVNGLDCGVELLKNNIRK